MKLEKDNRNRCFIVLYFDKDGLVDRYMTNMLRSIREDAAYILTVVNGFLTEEAGMQLSACCDRVLYRPNTGFDVAGYREGIFDMGFHELSKYDELVLMNYTFFGPLDSFEEMFREMNVRDLDFWGITEHYALKVDPYGVIPYGYLPEHLNSHFIALRRDFFMSFSYRDFIMNMKNPDSYVDSIACYEAVFTKYFADLGYKWEAYVDSGDYEEYSQAPFAYHAAELIRDKKCPILKRRNFFSDYKINLQNNAGESQVCAYEAVLACTSYDPALMWENVLRLQDLAQIHQTMHVNFYPDSEVSDHVFTSGETHAFVLSDEAKFKAVCGRYLRSIPDEIKVIYLDGSESYTEKLRQASMMAIGAKYVLVINPFDLPDPKGDVMKSSKASLLYGDMESLYGSRAVIGNILDTFESEAHIGLLVPPLPMYGAYFETLMDGWAGHFDELKAFAVRLGMTFPIIRGDDLPVYPYGGSFAARGAAFANAVSELAALIDEGESVSDDMARLLLPYLMQKQLFMTGVACGSSYASTCATNLDLALRENNKVVFKRFGPDFYWTELDKIRGKAP